MVIEVLNTPSIQSPVHVPNHPMEGKDGEGKESKVEMNGKEGKVEGKVKGKVKGKVEGEHEGKEGAGGDGAKDVGVPGDDVVAPETNGKDESGDVVMEDKDGEAGTEAEMKDQEDEKVNGVEAEVSATDTIETEEKEKECQAVGVKEIEAEAAETEVVEETGEGKTTESEAKEGGTAGNDTIDQVEDEAMDKAGDNFEEVNSKQVEAVA